MLSVPAALLALALLAGCEPAQPRAAGGPPPAPKVTVAKPAKRMVADQDEYVGRFVAVDAVEMRARVSGYLDAIHFKDGQLVKKGDLLFTIDRRPFEASLAQAQANLAQARANLAYAEADLERGQGLVRGSTITQQTFDQRTQAKRVAEASVAAQEAAVRQATLDLEFTELRAPVSGRIGDRRVSAGNLVTGGTTGTTTLLATITSIDPIRFEFTMDETSYLRYMRLAGDAAAEANRGINVPVRLKLIDEPKFSPRGQNGLRRQRHRPRLRHHPWPRRVCQSRGHPHARHVRAHPGSRRGARGGVAGAGCRHRHRAGAQVRARGRRRERRAAEIRDPRSGRWMACAWSRRGSSPTTASSSTA